MWCLPITSPIAWSPNFRCHSMPWVGKKSACAPGRTPSGRTGRAIGAWLPELEFTHYWATRQWRDLIAACDFHIAVSGNALAATAFMQEGVPYLSWIATGWKADRLERVQNFSFFVACSIVGSIRPS